MRTTIDTRTIRTKISRIGLSVTNPIMVLSQDRTAVKTVVMSAIRAARVPVAGAVNILLSD